MPTLRRSTSLLLAATVLVLAVVLAVRVTADDRAAGARRSLERAAAQLEACHRASGTYRTCTFETSGVAVQWQARRTFTVMSAVEFGPTYVLKRTANGREVRTCSPRGEHCDGTW